jgi:hypothetical protein
VTQAALSVFEGTQTRLGDSSCIPGPDNVRVPFLSTVVRLLSWLGALAVLVIPFASPGGPLGLVNVAMQQPPLAITGSIGGLTAGVPAGLTLTLRSSADTAVEVHRLTARVTGVSAGCAETALVITAWAGRLVVPPHGSAIATLPVQMTSTDCVGSTWQLAYTST